MKQRAIKVGPRTHADIARIGRYIAIFGAPVTAEAYVVRLYELVMRLDIATKRGIDRCDIRQGLRIIAFEKGANLALLVKDDSATLVRVFHRGQNWERALQAQHRSS